MKKYKGLAHSVIRDAASLNKMLTLDMLEMLNSDYYQNSTDDELDDIRDLTVALHQARTALKVLVNAAERVYDRDLNEKDSMTFKILLQGEI